MLRKTKTLMLVRSASTWPKMGQRRLRLCRYASVHNSPVMNVPMKPGMLAKAGTLTPRTTGWDSAKNTTG